jgi:hypothetical protein
MYLNVVKAIHDKHIASIILNGDKLKPFFLNSGMRQGCLLSLLTLEFLARSIMQEEEIKGIQIGKETVKISPFADDLILFLSDPKNLPLKTRQHKQLQQSSRIQNQLTNISRLSIHQQ